MSDLFSIYEDSLNVVLKKIATIVESMNNLSKEKTESALNDAHNNLKEADRIFKQMELEVSSEKNQNSNAIANKFRNYKSEVEALRKKFLKMQENYISKKSKDALMIEGYNEVPSSRKAQKEKLIENEESTEGVKGQNVEMLNISNDSQANLTKKNEEKKLAKDEVFHEASSEKFLARLMRKENRLKLIIVIVTILLFLSFITFMIIKFTY